MTSPAGAWSPGRLQWGPVAQPIRRLPMQLYQRRVTSLPLVGGQAQGAISGTGTLTLSVGPSGAGNVWYPASATIQTTTGINDFSTCQVFLGPAGLGVTLLATLFPGGTGTAALAIPSMTPGQYIIATWTGAKPGDAATVNIVGMMDSVMPG
jgi:hypothetical protein